MLEIEEKKHHLRNFSIICAIGLLILIIYVLYTSRPLDEITDYQVYVETQNDGSMDITYRYEWKVLNDTREGPLTWVRLGLPNNHCEVTDFGGAIDHVSNSYLFSEPVLKAYLDRNYYKDQTAVFWFTIHQEDMLCMNRDDSQKPFYDFTPGWFNDIPIRHYTFTWKQGNYIVGHNADREEDGYLVWEGSLKKGGTRQMKVYCRLYGFINPDLVQHQDYSTGISGDSGPDISNVLIIILLTGYLGYKFTWGSDEENYSRGRGYYGHGSHRGGGGGGCACACAGCACACACAGGGRAGCSQKDFYHRELHKE